MDHSTSVGYRLAQQQQQEQARTLELRRRIAERNEAWADRDSASPSRAPATRGRVCSCAHTWLVH